MPVSRKLLRVKGSPSSPRELASEVNRVLELLGGELVSLSSTSQALKTLTDLGQPSKPNDAVRLQDLREEISRLEKKLQVQTSPSASGNPTGGGGGVFPSDIPAFRWWGEIGFIEGFDGSQFLFTPTESVITGESGVPHFFLANHQGLMNWVAGSDPPPGFWCWFGGRVQLNPADAPLAGDYLKIIFAEVEP